MSDSNHAKLRFCSVRHPHQLPVASHPDQHHAHATQARRLLLVKWPGPNRHVEDAIQQTYPDANSNRGRCVVQRLKRGDNNFQSSIGTQVDGRTYHGSPRALGRQWHERLPCACSCLLGGPGMSSTSPQARLLTPRCWFSILHPLDLPSGGQLAALQGARKAV